MLHTAAFPLESTLDDPEEDLSFDGPTSHCNPWLIKVAVSVDWDMAKNISKHGG